MDELISRKAVLDFTTEWCNRCGKNKQNNGVMCGCCDLADTIDFIEELPTIPQTYEWCKGCKEYDTENHCCHRYSSFIRETLQDNIDAVLEDIKDEIKRLRKHKEYLDEQGLIIMECIAVIDNHISGKEKE